MKRNIKLLSFLLAVLLAFSLLPVNPVYAVESTENITQELEPQEQEEFVLPDIVPEAESAERGYIGRAKEEEKDNYTFVFKNSDNTRTMRVYSHPVKYTDDDGNIKDITLDIQSRAGGGFETKDNSIKTTFGAKLSDGIRLQHENIDIKLIPANKNITPVLSEDKQTVTYTLDTKTSLEYSLTYMGFKEDIVVSEYTGQTEYEFLLYTNGLTVKEEMGSYYLADSEGNRKANIGDIIIFTADERNNTLGSLSCIEIKENQIYGLTIHVDEEYLKDEKTVYPIRIDPTFEITSATTEGAIEDVTICTGATYSGTAGILYLGTSNNLKYRIMMRFPNVSMEGITEDQVINATVELRDVMCQSVQVEVECRIFDLVPGVWSESTTTTWDGIFGDTYVGGVIDTKTIFYGNGNEGSDINRYSFDITSEAKNWANGSRHPGMGLVFKAADESFSSTEDRLKYFGSYNRSDYRTSFTLQYTDYTPAITLNATSVDILEGATRTLTATTTPAGATVTWSTSNSNVATVSSTGVVTAKKAGSATIYARFTDNGRTYTATCTVYVYIANGVYHIKNMNSNYYLHAKSGSISNLTDVYQYSKYSDSTSDTYRVRQMWKTYYLGEGRYSIRPMHKLDMALDVTGSNVDIYNIGTTDTLAGVPDYTEWTIEWYSTGYVFKNKGDSSRTMQIKDASTSRSATVVVSTYSTSLNCRWSITKLSSPPSGAYWFDKMSQKIVLDTIPDAKYIMCDSTYTISDLGLAAIAYSSTSNQQTFTWSLDNPDIATINSSTGVIIGKSSGKVKITAKRYIDGIYFTLSFNLIVIGTEQYNAGVRIASVNGKQYYDFTIPVNSLFEDAIILCEEHRCMNWTQYCEWAYDISVLYQPSISEHTGMQLGSFLWFYEQVNHNAVWDIKREIRWQSALPDVPFLKEDGVFLDFVFRGEVTTAEGLGNIMYGYTGRATGFGETTLYWGGGVAAQGSVNSDEVTNPPYYGDTKEDHENIKRGFDMFNEDYPEYPDIGYDGIPLDGWLAAIADVILNPGT